MSVPVNERSALQLLTLHGRWPRWGVALLAHELARHHLAWDIEDATGPTALSAEGTLITLALAGPQATLSDWCETLEGLSPGWQERFRYRPPNGGVLSTSQVSDSVHDVAVAVTADKALTMRVRLTFAGFHDPGARGALPLRWAS